MAAKKQAEKNETPKVVPAPTGIVYQHTGNTPFAEDESAQQMVAPVSQNMQMMSMLEKVVMMPDVPIERIEQVIKIKNDMEDRENQKAFYADLASMQVELPRVIKSKEGHNSKYAPLEDINDAVRPAFVKYGFAVTFRVTQPDGQILVDTILSHKGGHHITTEILLAPDTSGSKNGVQAVSSSVSYGKRIGISALLNVSTGDDADGAAVDEEGSSKSAKWIGLVNGCSTLAGLQKVYKEAFDDLQGDYAGLASLMKAKDNTKKDISSKGAEQ